MLLKAAGGAFLVGPDGLTLMGPKHETSTKGGRGIMADNPIFGWIPSAIPTAALAIPMFPNINMIMKFGVAAQTLVKSAGILKTATQAVKTLI